MGRCIEKREKSKKRQREDRHGKLEKREGTKVAQKCQETARKYFGRMVEVRER